MLHTLYWGNSENLRASMQNSNSTLMREAYLQFSRPEKFRIFQYKE